MMQKRTIYEIQQDIAACVDTETGEILDQSKLDALNIEKDDKFHGVGLAYKNEVAYFDALDKEMKRLADEKRKSKARMEGYKSYLAANMQGMKKKWADCSIGWRKSESVEVQDVKAVPDEYLIQQDPKVDKAGLKKILKDGGVIAGVSLIEKNNIQIR